MYGRKEREHFKLIDKNYCRTKRTEKIQNKCTHSLSHFLLITYVRERTSMSNTPKDGAGGGRASVSDETRANCCQKLTFSWLFPLIKLGYSRQLLQTDIGDNYDRDRVAQHLRLFEENLRKGKPEDITWTIWKSFSRLEYYAVACKFVSDLCSYVPPVGISFIVSYAENPSEWGDNIWYAVAAMLVAPLITGLCNHWFYQFVMVDGLHARTAIQAAVYSKVLRVSNSARTRSADKGGVADTITNLQSTDCRSIEMCYWMWMYVWAAPLQAVVTTVLLYVQLGWPIFIGILFLVLMMPIQKVVMGVLKKRNKIASEKSDRRIKLITEVIHGIQVVKLQAWEKIFAARIKKTRNEELNNRRSIAIVQGLNASISQCAPIMCTLITFIVYGMVSETPLTAGKAFTTLALFNILRLPLMVLPMLIGMVAGAKVAAKRLGAFLYCDDLVNYVTYEEATGGKAALETTGASFVWDDKADSSSESGFRLQLGKFSAETGTLTVIAGKVGAGKSSLLSALLGEMHMLPMDDSLGVDDSSNPSVVCRGSVAYCAQEPWIQNATLKDNILFGAPYDEVRYNEVLKACALEADIKALPGGDQTEIGERGINLSGGQKCRVSLGRACYADKDIVVLDDILSAVDAHVARTITDKCLVEFLRNRGKTVILATHQTLCFPNADSIVVLKDGNIAFHGNFEDAKKEAKFSEILGSMDDLGEEEKAEAAAAGEVELETATVQRGVSRTSSIGSAISSKQEKGKLTAKEATAEGAVTCSVYTSYAAKVGVPLSILIFLLVASMNGQQVVVNWWLSRWSVSSSLPEKKSVEYYLFIYFLLGLGACVLILAYQIVVALGGLGAAAGIHERMFNAIIKAPMSFFDTTPSGQILNRFTADMKSIDEQLISQLGGALALLFMMASVIFTIIAVVPWVLAALVPLFLFYGWIQLVYRNTARELKRFDSATQSPIFNYFAETVNGLSSIRAFKCEERLLVETTSRIDYNSRFWTKNNFVNRWLGLRLDWIGAFLVGFTALACVLAVKLSWSIDPGLIGLVLSYTATLTGLLNWGVRRFSEAEMGMVAVERTKSLTGCPQESTTDPLKSVPENWPSEGRIKLQNVSARYRDGLPKVLNGIDISIPKFTKVGVCGRTGSGKSTLAKCLFRLMETSQGSILIDDIDVSKVELPTLRKRITMIPQDPTLFAGPLRYSLDPGNLYSDDQLWNALDSVDMKDHVKALENGLNYEIVDGGENLSAGQRQLLCMARALLESPKVLIMDEATSNIDGNTDSKIQEMLKGAFKDCTVLSIAHRIDTIMWYDKVLVLDHGKVLEYDSPESLSKTEGSEFKALLTEYRKGREGAQ